MSKEADNYTVQAGGLAYHKAGNRLLYVDSIDAEYASVTYERNGEYVTITFTSDSLETAHSRAKKEIEFQRWLFEISSDKHQATHEGMKIVQ